jgi:hypothetical protein
MPETTVKVKVKAPFRVVHEGKPYTDGDEVVVPEKLADEWSRSKFVARVTSKEKS